MSLPVVAIVGRPNVGKSSILNWLSRQRISIVEQTPGVTRDRVTVTCEMVGRYYDLVDTGGYGVEDRDHLTEHVERQIQFALAEAAVVLFVVDVTTGITNLDQKVARLLKPYHDRVVLVANKADGPTKDADAAVFVRLGYGEPIVVSALHRRGRGDVEEALLERLDDAPDAAPAEAVMKVAVIGRQNTGKSTFINAIAGEEHVIVSEVPGTTRDAIDLRFERDGRSFIAIDTAGVRKKSRWSDPIDFYGYTRVERNILRADVCVLFIDSTSAITTVDKRLASGIVKELKPCVLVVNKWDLAKERSDTEAYESYLTRTLTGLDYAPIVFVSAKDAHNTDAVIDTAWSLFNQAQIRVSTGELNRVLAEALAGRGPSVKRGEKPPRIYYATQVATLPPTIVCFVNRPSAIKQEYQRYLRNRLQVHLPFEEVPIRLLFRPRRGSDPVSAPG